MCLGCCSGLVITMVVSLFFILLLRYTAGMLLWLIVFGVIAAVGYGEYEPLPVATAYVVQYCPHILHLTFFNYLAVSHSVVMAKCMRFIFVLLCCIFPYLSLVSLCLRYLALLLGV